MARDHLTLLPADADPDPAKRIAAYGPPPGFPECFPLPMQIGRELQVAVLEDNLTAISTNMPRMPREERPELEHYERQLQSFLQWVKRYPDMNVWCSVAPEPLAPGT